MNSKSRVFIPYLGGAAEPGNKKIDNGVGKKAQKYYER
jgi:hypothetical protein